MLHKIIFLPLTNKMNSLLRTAVRLTSPSLIGSRFLCTQPTVTDVSKLVKNNKVVVFMKGVPDAPQCGFSNAVVQIFRMHGVTYDSHNVLANEVIRQGVKDFTNWPTIPQIFIDGEFVGGCDIMLQMHQSGELVEELKKVGITSALLEQNADNEKKTDK